MPQFRYRAVTHAGEIVVGEVDASSCEEVVRRIEYLGHLTIDAEIAATGILDRGRGSIGKLPRSRDVSIFLRQLPYRVTELDHRARPEHPAGWCRGLREDLRRRRCVP